MNPEQFLQEVLNSDNCPDNFEEIYKKFQCYQRLAINTLIAFHDVCEKKHIPYQLAYGTLLGAIRDNGQIPWDYDVDVFVPYDYKDDLIAALKDSLDNNFYFYCPEVNSRCRHFFIRLAPKGYRTEAIHVDVFYLIGSPDNESERKAFGEHVDKIFNMRRKKLVDIKDDSRGRVRTMVHLLMERLECITVSVDTLSKEFNELCTKYDYFSSKISLPTTGGASFRRFDTKKIWETSLIKTANGTFRIPNNYDEVLKSVYGDYMMTPDLKSRLKEMLSFYNTLQYYDGK